jgi:hypothetical protein
MEAVKFVVLAVLATYLLGLLAGLAGLRNLREPLRYHVGALAILVVEVTCVALVVGEATLIDVQRALVWLVGPVVLWWAHQLWSHRDRPDPASRPKAPAQPTPHAPAD